MPAFHVVVIVVAVLVVVASVIVVAIAVVAIVIVAFHFTFFAFTVCDKNQQFFFFVRFLSTCVILCAAFLLPLPTLLLFLPVFVVVLFFWLPFFYRLSAAIN